MYECLSRTGMQGDDSREWLESSYIFFIIPAKVSQLVGRCIRRQDLSKPYR